MTQISTLTDEEIKEKWIEICQERPKGCVISSTEMTRQGG